MIQRNHRRVLAGVQWGGGNLKDSMQLCISLGQRTYFAKTLSVLGKRVDIEIKSVVHTKNFWRKRENGILLHFNGLNVTHSSTTFVTTQLKQHHTEKRGTPSCCSKMRASQWLLGF
jgi:hypothetical protein